MEGFGAEQAWADLAASDSAPGCISFPSSAPSQGLRAFLACSHTLAYACLSKSCHPWKGKRRLNRPGAVLVAMSAASIRKVPEPHMGSARMAPASMACVITRVP